MGGLTHAGVFHSPTLKALVVVLTGVGQSRGHKKPSVDAADDRITLNQKVQVGRRSELQAFRT